MIFKNFTEVSLITSVLLFFSTSPAGAAIKTLNGLNAMDQTFANDSNVQINSPTGGSVHNIIWNGLLPISRGGTGANSFTSGSVLFYNGTSFSQDNSNIFWDNTNKRLGIGTSSPSSALSVTGNTSVSGDLNVTGNITGNITSTNLVPYTGATDSVDLGDHSLFLGSAAGFGSGHGYIRGINSPEVGGVGGGVLSIFGGAGSNGYSGGYIEIIGGPGRSSGGPGGGIYVIGGDGGAGGNSDGGNVEFRSGVKAGSGQNGAYRFLNPDQSLAGILDFSLLTSSNKTYTFPNTSGTFGLLGADQAWSGLNKFEGSTNSTIYVGSSTKSSCIALGDSDGDGITYITANDGVLTASTTKPGICQ